MKRYEDMTREEIERIVKTGGSDKVRLNQIVADYLDGLELGADAREVIAGTDIGSMAAVFGGMFTSEEVESFAKILHLIYR